MTSNDIDPHTGYPMKFERHSDRWSPVYVEPENSLADYLWTIAFAIFFALLFFMGV